MLTISHPFAFDYLVSETKKITSHVTPRMMIASAAVFTILVCGLGMAALASAAPSCAVGQSLLVYSKYNRKGIETDHQFRCGLPHQTCALRSVPLGSGQTYDCSAFVLPKGTLSW